MKSRATLLLSLLAATLLAGCATRHTEAPKLADARGNLQQTHYQGEIVAPDGVKFRFTVFQPALRAGQTAPLVIHAHGFSLTRMESTFDMYAKVLLAGKAAIDAWNKGYWVISIDQRGHGDTGGKIGLIEEDKEVADVVRLIDWAQQNLALTAVDGDPKIGMIGESYGGGVQMLASVVDPRIDALVPITTWFDLDEALFPQGVPKSEWLLFLGAVGYGLNPFHMDWGNVTKPVAKEILFDARQPMLHARLRANSLAQHCEAGQYPHADALLIQGMRDVVFPLNQALDARECFLAGGRDVRLVAVEHGHLAPTAQLSPRLPIWWVNPDVTCNNHGINLQRMIGNWFDLKLRDKKFTTDPVPTWCITGDRTADATATLPSPVNIEMPAAHVGSGVAGLVEWAARPLETAKNWFVRNRLPEDWREPSNGWLRPARVPLYVAEEPTWVVGVPRVTLNFSDTDRREPILFLRLAAWKPGSGNYRVLSQQVTPVKGNDEQVIELNAVRHKLKKGEVVGLLVNGWSNQFRLTGSGLGTDASISGSIELPVTKAVR